VKNSPNADGDQLRPVALILLLCLALVLASPLLVLVLRHPLKSLYVLLLLLYLLPLLWFYVQSVRSDWQRLKSAWLRLKELRELC
jgi:membrane protease YdiL (CAAX protease family)